MKYAKKRVNLIEIVVPLLLILIFSFINGGIVKVAEVCGDLLQLFLAIPVWLNMITVSLVGDSIITVLLNSTITFIVVGLIFSFTNAPRGKIGSIFGKGLFWLIAFPVSFILNFIGMIIF